MENEIKNKNQEMESLRKDYKLLEKLQKNQEKIIQASKNIEEETFVKKVSLIWIIPIFLIKTKIYRLTVLPVKIMLWRRKLKNYKKN